MSSEPKQPTPRFLVTMSLFAGDPPVTTDWHSAHVLDGRVVLRRRLGPFDHGIADKPSNSGYQRHTQPQKGWGAERWETLVPPLNATVSWVELPEAEDDAE
jgi:hypothetical protein